METWGGTHGPQETVKGGSNNLVLAVGAVDGDRPVLDLDSDRGPGHVGGVTWKGLDPEGAGEVHVELDPFLHPELPMGAGAGDRDDGMPSPATN